MNNIEIVNGIRFKLTSCQDKYGNIKDIGYNLIDLYIILTKKCNVNCSFCEYHNGLSDINIDKFKDTLNWLLNFCSISTVHFTGGEPTLEIDKLKQLCKIIKQENKLIKTSVNTNGTRLKELEDIEELDNIALSRHAISDEDNRKIFNSNLVPSAEDIGNFKDKHKLHLSCNLIKGYVDSKENILKYLEFVSTLGVNDVGIVSLMNINEFCNQHYIDFESLDIQENERLIKSRCFRNISEETGDICCKCENYLYRASNMNLISMYHRYAIKNNEIADYLVYDNNTLKQGFNGNIINYGGKY